MKIVIGYRGKNIGQDLLSLAVKHAKAFDAAIHVVTSLVGGEKTTKTNVIEAEQLLTEAKDYLAQAGLSCETHLLVRGKTPGEDIVAFAQEIEADEILMGVKSRSKVGKLLFGSTAQYVIIKAHCPVVSVK